MTGGLDDDAAPLLSSRDTTIRYDGTKDDVLRPSSKTGIADESSANQNGAAESDDVVPDVNLYLIMPSLLVGTASTILADSTPGAVFCSLIADHGQESSSRMQTLHW